MSVYGKLYERGMKRSYREYFNTVFRQVFLLIQYSFMCKQYFFCSDREYQYFFDRW